MQFCSFVMLVFNKNAGHETDDRELSCKQSVQVSVDAIGVGPGNFLGVRRIFAQNFPSLPEKFVCDFAYKFSPTKIIKTFFWYELQKKGLHVFIRKRRAPFFKSNNVGHHFCSDF